MKYTEFSFPVNIYCKGANFCTSAFLAVMKFCLLNFWSIQNFPFLSMYCKGTTFLHSRILTSKSEISCRKTTTYIFSELQNKCVRDILPQIKSKDGMGGLITCHLLFIKQGVQWVCLDYRSQVGKVHYDRSVLFLLFHTPLTSYVGLIQCSSAVGTYCKFIHSACTLRAFCSQSELTLLKNTRK